MITVAYVVGVVVGAGVTLLFWHPWRRSAGDGRSPEDPR